MDLETKRENLSFGTKQSGQRPCLRIVFHIHETRHIKINISFIYSRGAAKGFKEIWFKSERHQSIKVYSRHFVVFDNICEN